MPLPPWEEYDEEGDIGSESTDTTPTPAEPTSATDPVDTVLPQGEAGGSSEVFPDNILRSRDRKKKQRLRAQYSAIREEAQLAGVIPTTPEGAVRNEVVDPKTQSEQVFPSLVSGAIRRGWAVPEEKKPVLVDEMIAVVEDVEQSSKTRIAAFNALRLADTTQYERDHPEEAGKAKGGGGSVSVQANIQAVAVIRQMVEAGEVGHIGAVSKLPLPPLEPPPLPALEAAPEES